MSDDKRDVVEVLKFELEFLEQGGYGRSVRTPWKATSVFQDSTSCLNFNDPARPHPCNECLLTDFVPREARKRAFLATSFRSTSKEKPSTAWSVTPINWKWKRL